MKSVAKMRVRKKPDLRLHIPSYPYEYAEMPPEIRRRTLEAMQTPDITSPGISQTPSVTSPAIIIETPEINEIASTIDQTSDITDNTEVKSAEVDKNESKTHLQVEISYSEARPKPPRTPEVQFVGPEDLNGPQQTQNKTNINLNDTQRHINQNISYGHENESSNLNSDKIIEEDKEIEPESPIVFRNKLRRGSLSVPYGLRYHETDRKTTTRINVSLK